MIRMQDVHLKYPGAAADTIRGVSFAVEAGEIFGFLGPSGAGKSTLQKILTGVLPGYRGRVEVLGREMREHDRGFFEQIGVDFEFPNFYHKFTALENLQYFASLYRRQGAAPLELLERVGLADQAHKRVGEFSKGMKMRLGFVRALLHDPQLLFLDEPFSGLDPANAKQLKELLLEQQARGKTVILTTHNMQDADQLCDRVAFIVDGQIKALDTPRAFHENGAETQVCYDYAVVGESAPRRASCLLAGLAQDRVFQTALAQGRLRRIQTQEQTLEDVFLQLTGRCLQ